MRIVQKEKPHMTKVNAVMLDGRQCKIDFFSEHMEVTLPDEIIVEMEYGRIGDSAAAFIKRPMSFQLTKVAKAELERKDWLKPQKKKTVRDLGKPEEKGFYILEDIAKVYGVTPEAIRNFQKENEKSYPLFHPGQKPYKFELHVGKKLLEEYGVYRQRVKEQRKAHANKISPWINKNK